MAVYFLAKSQTYVAKTERTVYRRREVVAEHLKENYKAIRNADRKIFERVAAALKKENIVISFHAYGADKAVLRAAYLWLMAGTDEKRQGVYNKVSPSTRSGITCLSKDGILNWSDLGLGAAPTDEHSEEAEPPLRERLNLADFTAGREVMELSAQIVAKLQAMMEENERLKQANKRLETDNADLAEKASESEEYNHVADDEIAALTEKLRQAWDSMRTVHAATLEEIVEQNPEFPQLRAVAEQIRASAGQRQMRMRDLEKRLPRMFTWASETGKMDYKPAFLKALADLAAEEQTQVISRVEILGKEGAEYASLHTRKARARLPNSPIGCLTSRGADDLRFTWSKNGTVTVHWLYRKGNSRVREKE